MSENNGAMARAWNNLPNASKFATVVIAGAIGIYLVKKVIPQAIDKGYDVGATIDQDGIHFGMRAPRTATSEGTDQISDVKSEHILDTDSTDSEAPKEEA